MTGLVLAAEYPERVRSLVIVNGAARMRWAPDYPAGATVISSENPFITAAMERDAFVRGFKILKTIGPSVADDDAFRTWWDAARQQAMAPSLARAIAKQMVESKPASSTDPPGGRGWPAPPPFRRPAKSTTHR